MQEVFRRLSPKAKGAPHKEFWNKPYEEFVEFEFTPNTADGKVRLLVKGDGANSNLVRALQGKDLATRLPDGRTQTFSVPQMPPGGKKVSPEDVERIRRWIDHGAPKVRPAGAPKPGGEPPPSPPSPPVTPPAGPPPAPPAAPPAEPAAATPPAPPATAGEWLPDDLDYAGVQALFVALNRKATAAPHGNFWKLSYDQFVNLEVTPRTREGIVKLLVKGDGEHSNLVKALRGKPMTILLPDGQTTEETDLGFMPPSGARMADADVERIRRWIDHGAPKNRP